MATPATQSIGYRRLIRFEELDSTNSEALRRADEGEQGPLWIVAQRQSAGRGRRNRAWASESGNLFASLLTRPGLPPGVAGQLSFVAAVALYDAIADLAPALAPALSIKWPNDILAGPAKLSGILLESRGGTDGLVDALVIGFGVNCASHPEDTVFPATDLAAEGVSVAPEALLSALVARFEETEVRWAAGAGFAAIRDAWLARAAGIGEAITVRLGSGDELHGTFAEVDEAGNLTLREADGRTRAIAAGDIFFAAARGKV